MLLTVAQPRSSAAVRAGLVVLAFSLSAFAAPHAMAQTAAATGQDLARETDKVIISNMPERRSRIYAMLVKVLGKRQGERLEGTQSEVWTVPQSRFARLTQRLRQFGCKVTRLREDSHHVLKRHQGPVKMSKAQQAILESARGTPGMVGVGMMKAPEAAVSEYALTGGANQPAPAGGTAPQDTASRIVIPINDTTHVTILRTKVVTNDKGSTWRGTIEETGESAVLMWWKGGHLSGVFGYKGHIYTIINMGGEVHAVVESDPKAMPPDHAPSSADKARSPNDRVASIPAQPSPQPAAATPAIKPFTDAERLALEAKPVVIDLMLLYTKRTASRYIRDPAELSALVVEQTNETMRTSGIGNVSFRLAHTQMIDYDETGGDHFSHLYRMVDGLGAFKDVRRLRNEKRADIVGLVLEDPSGCGLSTRVGADSEEAFFVVHHSCAAITISIAHEIGHILGVRHDRATDQNETPFPYGHGYINGTKWRDIMSYQQPCNGCPRIPFWSNPRVKFQGEPTGTEANDNARVILEQAERVSKFR